MEETKKLLVLVIVFNTFSLLMAATTTYCSEGMTKTAVVYITIVCIVFSGTHYGPKIVCDVLYSNLYVYYFFMSILFSVIN